MRFSYQAVALDAKSGDATGMLVLRDGALLAVVSRLGDMHGDLAGTWFVEALFNGELTPPRGTFANLPAFERWVASRLASRSVQEAPEPRT